MREVIFVGLPGPTHHYGGLSADNVAAVSNKGSISNPRQAALQALDLIRLLGSLGMEVAILPPQLRPHMGLLHQHFNGDDDAVIKQAGELDQPLLEKASSSSAMWAANAATVAPSIDCTDGKLHITTANLHTNLHRRLEAEATYHTLQAIFKAVPGCIIHFPLPLREGARGRGSLNEDVFEDTPPPLPSPSRGEGIKKELRDEGAANHMRLSPSHSEAGLHVFVYGGEDGRQDLAASQAIAAQHNIAQAQALFIKQNSEVIRAGVFHNDVIAVSNEHVLLVHEQAYAGGREDIARIAKAYETLHPGGTLTVILVTGQELTTQESVRTYVFNSQIVTKPDGTMAVIAPVETQALYDGKAAKLLEKICTDSGNPIKEIHTIDLRQSMRNGGGPACLRLRVPMHAAQLTAVKNNVNVFADDKLLAAVTSIIERYYPQELSAQDLGNPELYHACKVMLGELLGVMKLPFFLHNSFV